MNDVTQILEVTSQKFNHAKSGVFGISSELEMLQNYDFEHPTEDICELVF